MRIMDSENPLNKIKFTPLMQSLKDVASKCCLEIVPEISCIRNLDGIELHKGTHFIEYTIPLTYKITLKKAPKDKSKEYLDEEKTYHSCVDLIDSSSITENCKNLMRMLSDNKMVSHYGNTLKENKTKLGVKEKKDASDGTSEQLTVYIDGSSNQSLDNRHDKSTSSASDVKSIITEIYKDTDNDSKNETKMLSDTESKDKLIEIVRHSSTETDEFGYEKRLTLSSVYSLSTNYETYNYKKKLSISPAFSISAGKIEKPILVAHKRIGNAKTLFCPLHNSVSAKSELNIVNNDYKNVIGKFSRFNCYYKDRIPPDVKLAYYRQLMEKEVRPLTTTLNNILQKCVVLGVHEHLRKAANKSVDDDLTKRIDKQQSHVDIITGEPNRVVYDIVFDG